jgi:hypothetical protein
MFTAEDAEEHREELDEACGGKIEVYRRREGR